LITSQRRHRNCKVRLSPQPIRFNVSKFNISTDPEAPDLRFIAGTLADRLYCIKVGAPRFRFQRMVETSRSQWRICCETAIPDSPVKTDRKEQNYHSEILAGGMRSKVKPLFRYLRRTCNILGMCNLRTQRETLKMTARVARKLFATIRYRFSHLDNGLDSNTACGQFERFAITHK
jgi:hypothetical protein